MLEKYDKATAQFLKNMESNGLSKNSIESYARTFRMFREFMVQSEICEPTPSAVLDFKRFKSEGAGLTTIALYITHLRLLSNFCVENKIFDKEFITNGAMPPRKKVAAERCKEYSHTLTEEQIAKLISAEKPEYGRRSPSWLREKAETVLFLQSGLRNSELRSLTPFDLDWENNLIYARVTKGNKPRYVSFPRTAQNAVREYLNSGFRPCYVGEHAPLFGYINRSTGQWMPMDRKKLSERIFYYTKSVLGEEAACRTHALRHGYASCLLEHDMPMQYISESLGHSSVATTTIYAKRLTKNTPAKEIGNLLNSIVEDPAI